MGCGVYWQKVRRADTTLAGMREFTISETDPAYQHIYRQRGATLAQIGYKFPRRTEIIKETSVVRRLEALGLVYAGRSKGFTKEELKDAVIKVWYDDEEGFMAEARFKPGSPPIYRGLTDEEAFTFIKGEETGALIAKVFTADDYLGE